ncbi:MAG TPA: diphthine--ammonia ligase [Candidatus Paceibacterota bacterium]|nr:diphthine--ammonia ligase [Candidatus Paceibacterota bacterium]
MKFAILFSGGKDSCLALHKAREEEHEIIYLLNVFPETTDSFMFHKPDLKLLKQQAKEIGIPLIIQKSKGEKEQELDDLKKLIKKVKNKVDGICVGGIASSYQGNRIKKICSELGLKFYAPLWNYSPEDIWKELLDNKFKVVITKIAGEGISKEFLGKIIDRKNFEELKKLSERFKFRLDFEGGEAETAVLFMPGMKKEIKISFDVKSEGSYRHFLNITKIIQYNN